jgi:hypothetical protein
VIDRNLPVKAFIEVVPIHADHSLPTTKRDEAVLGETAVADEQATSPGRLLLDLALESMEVCSTGK